VIRGEVKAEVGVGPAGGYNKKSGNRTVQPEPLAEERTSAMTENPLRCSGIRGAGRGFHDRIFLALIFAMLLSGAACGRSDRGDAGGSETAGGAADTTSDLTLAVIPKGTTHVFWKSVEAGAKRAGTEQGVEIIWKGPLKENDRAHQIQVVQQFISQGVDGIVLAPLDLRALVAPVRQATGRGIPVVIMDSSLEGEPGTDFLSFVATDNTSGGRLGGEHLLELLGGNGRVVLLRYLVGSASTAAREEGFLEIMRESDGIEVLVDNRYAGPTAGEAKTQSLNMFDQVRRAEGIFCSNEPSTYGMLLALRQEGLAGQIRFVGFDASPPLVQALEAGEIDALVVQNPDRMGYEAVTTLVRHLRGESVPPVVDTGVALVTRENLNEPAIQALINPEG